MLLFTVFTVVFLSVVSCMRVSINKELSASCRDEGFEEKIVFHRHEIVLNPANPVLPGQFDIEANVTVLTELKYVGAELELRLGDWESEPLACQDRERDGCGGMGSCAYCDFCKGFKKLHPTIRKDGVGVKKIHGCPITPGNYTVSATVHIKNHGAVGKNIPTDLSSVSRKKHIMLYTTLWIYDTRFNDLNKHVSPEQRAKIFNEKKNDYKVGCYRVVSTVDRK